MNLDFFSFVTGLVSSLFVMLFTYLLNLDRDRRIEHNKAVEKFRDAFLPELRQVRDLFVYDADSGVALCNSNVRDPLVAAYGKHHDAKVAFESRLSFFGRWRLSRAWKNYAQEPTDGLPKEILFAYYSDDIPETETKARQYVLKRLEKLLSLANYR